jgi:hypothetical protein
MTTPDRQDLRQLVQLSVILSDTEREYWLQNLPNMSDEQCTKLEKILYEATAPSPFEHEIQQFIELAVQSAMQVMPQGLTVSA